MSKLKCVVQEMQKTTKKRKYETSINILKLFVYVYYMYVIYIILLLCSILDCLLYIYISVNSLAHIHNIN